MGVLHVQVVVNKKLKLTEKAETLCFGFFIKFKPARPLPLDRGCSRLVFFLFALYNDKHEKSI